MASQNETGRGWIMMQMTPLDRSVSLVPLDRSAREFNCHVSGARPDASFVTHLIAVAAGTPQTRILRRATPADAHNDYGLAVTRGNAAPAPKGGRISRIA